jgi:hypothetical protein
MIDNITGPDPRECNTDEHEATFEVRLVISVSQRTSHASCDKDMDDIKAKIEKAIEALGFETDIADENIFEK